ncbi:MAG: hypothetical protein GXO62_00610, partial [Epsilonproteobacteria bacterium]|nr:hypothetical protein [Campylobacterota bacterium]
MQSVIHEIIESIAKDDNIRVATTNKEVFDGELIDSDVNLKRYYHFIILDKNEDIKPYFRALRNGGYIVSFVKFDDEYLQDVGFSAISEVDGLQVIKKVHSWN